MDYRINGFEQIKSFYSWVFSNPEKVRPTHISLYLFLLNQNNRSNWVEWFKCPYDLAMQGACIGNNGTYYRCLDDLKEWKLIDYKKGLNNYKAPLVKLFVLYDYEQVTVPLSEQPTEQVSEQQYAQLSEQLPAHIYKLITDNIKLITSKESEFEKLLNDFLFKQDNFSFRKALTDFGVDKTIIDEWMKVRKLKRLTNSETAFKAIQKQIYNSGLTPNECIKIAVEKSWGGFEAEWIINLNKNKNGNDRRDLSQIDHSNATRLADM